jgi:lipoprotein NlpD
MMKRYCPLAIVLLVVLSACQSGYQSTKPGARPKPVATAPSAPPRAPIAGDSHVVQTGDTLYGIAFRAGLNFRDIAAWNGIEEPYTIRRGQRLRLTPPPDSAPAVPKTAPSLPNAKPVLSKTPVVESAIKPAMPAVSKPVELVASNVAWTWPAKGALIGRFVAGDKANQGINIAGKNGQDVRAAADGVVVYSGAGLIGYGELLIIKHNNEWISAYAHNQKRLVAEGTRVKAGQLIAEMGQTGTIRSMLHFEIRRNGKPVDPLLYLPKL